MGRGKDCSSHYDFGHICNDCIDDISIFWKIMIYKNKNYVDLAKKFIDEHNNNNNWSPFDRIEIMAIMMYAEWLENRHSEMAY